MELRAAAGAPDGDVLHRAHRTADAVALHLPHRGQGHARTRAQRPPRDHRREQGQCTGGIPRNGRQHQHGLPRTRLFQQPRRPHPAGQHPLPGKRGRGAAVAGGTPGKRSVLLPLDGSLRGRDIPDHGFLRKQFRPLLLRAQPAQLHEAHDEPRTAGQRTDPLHPRGAVAAGVEPVYQTGIRRQRLKPVPLHAVPLHLLFSWP